MRILGIVDANSVHTVKWANYFAARDHAVHLVSFNAVSEESASAYHSSVTIDRWLVPTFHLKRFWRTLDAIRRLRSIFHQQQSQIVHVHFLGYAAWLTALARIQPLVTSVMGGGDIMGDAWRPASRRERVLTPLTLRRSAAVLCWSANLAAIVRGLVRGRVEVEVVVGGVDLSLFRRSPEGQELRRSLALSQADYVILSPRLMRPRSNIAVIVNALARVLPRIPRARLLLVMYQAESYPEYTAQIQRQIDELGVRAAVRLLPNLPNPEMPRHYSAADCTVSIPATDGTPMTVMESVACGTPAIILDLPDYDRSLFVHGQTVIRIPDADPAALAEALIDLAKDRRMAEALISEGRDLVARYANYDREMQRVHDIYTRLLAVSG